jgi:eukaryotic-like serine/threonine-protein kinase
MSFKNYLKSRSFFFQLFLAIIAFSAFIFLFLNMLSFITNHGKEVVVPNLDKLTIEQAEEKLDDLDLEYVILDTLDYDKSIPKFVILKQDPSPGSKVKVGRKIYIKINAGNYEIVTLPDLKDKSYRQAEQTLNVMNIIVDTIEYEPFIGKDMVLNIKHNGKIIPPGTKLYKASKVVLVLGDGKIAFDTETQDTIIDYEEVIVPEDEF